MRCAAASLLLILLRAQAQGAAAAQAPDRALYLVDASSFSATSCWRESGRDLCRAETRSELLLPPPLQPLTFAAFGDCGRGTPAQGAVARLLERLDPQLVLLLGDIVYPTGKDEDYDSLFFPYYRAVMARRPFFPAVGNHDYGNSRFFGRGKRRFTEGYARVFRRPPYYSFDAGPVHFVSLDTNQAHSIRAAAPIGPDSEQLRWLEKDLASARAPWKIVFIHVPLYSTIGRSDNAFLRQALEPLLRRHGVDVVLAGHDHVYERSRALDGFIHVVAGTGGAALHRAKNTAPWLEKRLKRHGLILAHAEEHRLLLEFIGDDGQKADSVELKK